MYDKISLQYRVSRNEVDSLKFCTAIGTLGRKTSVDPSGLPRQLDAHPFVHHWFFFYFPSVTLILIYCIYDTFIVSEMTTMKLIFSFGNRWKSQGAKSGEYWGWRRNSKPHSVAATMATCDVWAGALTCKRGKPRGNFSLQSYDAAASVLLHNMHRLSWDLP